MGPFSPGQLLAFILLISFVIAFIQVGALTLAFDKLGLSQASALVLLFSSFFGSAINLPLFKIDAERLDEGQLPPQFRSLLRMSPIPFTGKTVVAVNLGGCLIPLTFCLYLLLNTPLDLTAVAIATAVTSTVSYLFSRPVPGLGIGMPIFIAPIAAAITAILVDPQNSAPLAYICGTLGVLIGADILRLKDIRSMGAPLASVGGAGTFDGIFITGIVAVLLA